MTHVTPYAANSPLAPVYPFNEPGEPMTLHNGLVGVLGTDVPGRIELRCASDLNLGWEIASLPDNFPGFIDNLTLMLRRLKGDAPLPVVQRSWESGWTNGTVIGSPDTRVSRVVAHWFNLPNFDSRWDANIGEWRVSIEPRADRRRVWQDLHLTRVYVMTHVVEIRRVDDAYFTSRDVVAVLATLHVGMSFALGRWVAPILPVGLDRSGEAVWEEWRALHCDPARKISSGWWHEQHHDSLVELLTSIADKFANADEFAARRLQLMLAIAAMTDQGFVEERIMIGGSALEHIMWQTLVLGGQVTENQYGPPAHLLLRRVLTAAGVPTDIDAQISPTIAQFVTEETHRQGQPLDGPDVVTQIRNRLVHPKGGQDQIYRLNGLVTEVWALTRHYVVLLILHSLGYCGSYRDLRKLQGSAWDVGRVPWA